MLKTTLRVFLADRHPLVREGLTRLISDQFDLEVCGETDDAEDAERTITEMEPDIAIVEMSLKRGFGREFIKSVAAHCPRTAVFVFSAYDEMMYAECAILAGARAYVMKDEPAEVILAAIRRVLSGRIYVSPEVAEAFVKRFLAQNVRSRESLSGRELEVFALLGQGLKTRAVADALSVSTKTVHTYCTRIKKKLSLANGNELVREAVYSHVRHTSG